MDRILCSSRAATQCKKVNDVLGLIESARRTELVTAASSIVQARTVYDSRPRSDLPHFGYARMDLRLRPLA